VPDAEFGSWRVDKETNYDRCPVSHEEEHVRDADVLVRAHV
jgi:hypothetical protein